MQPCELLGTTLFAHTYRYVKKAMPQKFKSFSLANLAIDLDLEHKKMETSTIACNMEWFERNINNTITMIKYNILHCEVTLDLCFSLDLINQIIALCSMTRSYILDVMLYSTGAIAASCLCNRAYDKNCRYVWTRCDYWPSEFEGGEVYFRSPIVYKNPMIIDFISMYPSAMSSTLISPEFIDYVDRDLMSIPRFDHRLVVLSSCNIDEVTYIGITMYGLKNHINIGCNSVFSLAKHCSLYPSDVIEHLSAVYDKCKSVVNHWNGLDPINSDLATYLVKSNDVASLEKYKSMTPITQLHPFVFEQSEKMKSYCVLTKHRYDKICVPSEVKSSAYSIDWEHSPLGVETIIGMPQSVCKHTLCVNIASVVSDHVMTRRREVKNISSSIRQF